MSSPYRTAAQAESESKPESVPMRPSPSKWSNGLWLQIFLSALGGSAAHAIGSAETVREEGARDIVSAAEAIADEAWKRMYEAGQLRVPF